MYRLVIVDDEETSRSALCDFFPWEDCGYEVVAQFGDGRSAFNWILNHKVDVVLCDIVMPDMDGLSLAKQLYERHCNVKLVFFSAHRNFDYARSAICYGAKDYLVKPAKYRELLEVFARIHKELDAEQRPSPQNAALGNEPLCEGNGYSAKIVQLVNEYLENNYRDATLESAAQHVGLNPSYLSQFYKAKTGKYFSEVLTRVRMERALELLNDARYRIADISEMVGYMNAKNFSRAFKRYYGKLPRERRNEP